MRNTPQRKAKLSFLYKHVVTIGLTVQASSCFKLWRSNQRGKRECGTKGKGAAPTNKNVPTEWKVSLSIISPEVKTFSFSILCLMNDFCLLFEKWLLSMSYGAFFFLTMELYFLVAYHTLLLIWSQVQVPALFSSIIQTSTLFSIIVCGC